MNIQRPLVSILLPVHNCERFLDDCLKSLVSQSYRQIEIIAIDDKSSDNSLKILKSFAKRYKKVKVYKNVKRYGIVMTLNRLLRKAKGDCIAFMSAKDMSARSRIKKQDEFLLGNQGVVAVGAQCRFLNKKNKIIGKTDFPGENQFIYSDVLMKLLPYSKFANLPKYYHYHRNDPKAYFGDLRIHLISLIKLWIKSMANYDYQLSFKSFFFPLIKRS